MMLCLQKVTNQGKICRFSTTIIENSAFAIFVRYEYFFKQKLESQGYSSNFNSPFYAMPYVLIQRHIIDPKMR